MLRPRVSELNIPIPLFSYVALGKLIFSHLGKRFLRALYGEFVTYQYLVQLSIKVFCIFRHLTKSMQPARCGSTPTWFWTLPFSALPIHISHSEKLPSFPSPWDLGIYCIQRTHIRHHFFSFGLQKWLLKLLPSLRLHYNYDSDLIMIFVVAPLII